MPRSRHDPRRVPRLLRTRAHPRPDPRTRQVSDLTNPKVGLFFLAVVPQFLPDGASAFGMTMLLGATLTVIGSLIGTIASAAQP